MYKSEDLDIRRLIKVAPQNVIQITEYKGSKQYFVVIGEENNIYSTHKVFNVKNNKQNKPPKG